MALVKRVIAIMCTALRRIILGIPE
jgi:hypothetical protein